MSNEEFISINKVAEAKGLAFFIVGLKVMKDWLMKHKPIYLLGGFGGVTSYICHIIKAGKIPEKLTQKWRIYNNSGYKNFLDYYQEKEYSGGAYNDEEVKLIKKFIELRKEQKVKLEFESLDGYINQSYEDYT